MKIYVASSWKNRFQESVVALLRELGHEVYDFKNPEKGNKGFSWSNIDIAWENWSTEEYIKALEHPIAEEGFNFDFNAMKWAECCLMILPCGRIANTEAGWMKGQGKEVWVYQPMVEVPELMYKMYDGIISSDDGLHEIFRDRKEALDYILQFEDQFITSDKVYERIPETSHKFDEAKLFSWSEANKISSEIEDEVLLIPATSVSNKVGDDDTVKFKDIYGAEVKENQSVEYSIFIGKDEQRNNGIVKLENNKLKVNGIPIQMLTLEKKRRLVVTIDK